MDLVNVTREPRRKIARARKLFAEAQAELDDWAAKHHTVGRLVPHADRRRIDLVLQAGEEPPLDDVSLIVGDAVHNLRAALDNLAWTLAHLSGPPPNLKAIQFPVSEKESGWRKARKDLASIPPSALDRIEMCQPFVFDRKEDAFLWHLHQMDIADKHRDYLVAQPTWTKSALEGLQLGLDAGTVMTPVMADYKLNKIDGEIIGSLEFSKPFWDRPVAGTVTIQTAFLVVAGVDGPGAALHEMCEWYPRATSGILDLVCGIPTNESQY